MRGAGSYLQAVSRSYQNHFMYTNPLIYTNTQTHTHTHTLGNNGASAAASAGAGLDSSGNGQRRKFGRLSNRSSRTSATSGPGSPPPMDSEGSGRSGFDTAEKVATGGWASGNGATLKFIEEHKRPFFFSFLFPPYLGNMLTLPTQFTLEGV